MRFCSIAAVYVMCFGVCAAPGYTLQQTKSFIHSAIQLKNPAKEVAETLHKMKLSEHQDLATVEGLQGPGAGPKTGAVLKELATESSALQEAQPPAPKPVYVPPRPPSSEQQARLLDVLTARLSYFNQKEDYKLLSKNGRVVTDVSYASVGGAFSMGDFGTDMRDIFDPARHASFAWERWATLRGRRTHVF